jgi:hypothetical protein
MEKLIQSYVSPKRHDLMPTASTENNVSDGVII